MKIGVGGCSHSSTLYGNPWWYYLGEDLNSTMIPTSSGASGNEKNIEKLKYIFETYHDIDLFVYQITEPTRFVVGIETPPKKIDDYLNDMGGEEDVPYYTFNGFGNNDRILERYGMKINFDEFFVKKIFTSDYNMKYKIFHTLMSIQYLSDLYQKKIIFFSWFLDIHKLAKESGYEKIVNNMKILNGCVTDFIKENNLPRLPKDSSHYGSETHEKIYFDYLKPQLKKYNING
jgi:hypothetical protein